jgi:hypothetical protein
MTKEDGSTLCRFKDIVGLRVSHFKNIYQEMDRANIAEIVKLASYFRRFIEEDMNEDLMAKSCCGIFSKG